MRSGGDRGGGGERHRRQRASVPPDLTDPAARTAYRRELRNVARPVRYLGLALAFAALAAAGARHWVPRLPVAVPVFLIAVAALHVAAGVVLRTRHHRARMRG